MAKRDYSKLRDQQLMHARAGGQTVDNNPEGYTERTYAELKNIKLPLVLDYANPPRRPWTVEEVIEAMMPAIRALAREFAGKRAGYLKEDAECDGRKAVLDALWTDAGLAWFAGYCYTRIKTSINRASKISGIIRAPERLKQWRDNVRYTTDTIGEGDATIGESISTSASLPQKVICGDYINGQLVRRTCDHGKIGDQICDRCKGTGLIVIRVEKPVQAPPERAEADERSAEAKSVWEILKQQLTPTQVEILELRYGLDAPDGSPRDPTEVAAIYKQRHGVGSKNRVQQALAAIERKLRDFQSKNKGLTEAIDRALNEGGE